MLAKIFSRSLIYEQNESKENLPWADATRVRGHHCPEEIAEKGQKFSFYFMKCYDY